MRFQAEKKKGTDGTTDVKNPVVDATPAATSAAAVEVAPTGAAGPVPVAPVTL